MFLDRRLNPTLDRGELTRRSRTPLPACPFSVTVGRSRASRQKSTRIGSRETSINCPGAGDEIRHAVPAELRRADSEALSGAHAGLPALKLGRTQDIRCQPAACATHRLTRTEAVTSTGLATGCAIRNTRIFMKNLTGSCLCGSVKIQVSDSFGFVGYCHCSECRKWSGSAFGTGALVSPEGFSIVSGEELVSYYNSSEQTVLGFCSNCGSSLFSRKVKLGKYIVRLGILDDAPTQRPDIHIFAASKAPWFEIADQLDIFDTVP